MGLPVLTKTWQFNVNNVVSGNATNLRDHQQLMLSLKNMLSGSGSAFSNPWIVAGSCDSSTFGNDFVDRWSVSSSLIWQSTPGAGAHSWIVLNQPAISTSCSLCIDLVGGGQQPRNIGLYFSPSGGFVTGGSTTTRPSASDEIVLRDGSAGSTACWFGNIVTTVAAARLHGMMSSDGTVTRIIMMTGSVPVLYWFVEKVQNPVTGNVGLTNWPVPVIAGVPVNAATVESGMDFTHWWGNSNPIAGVANIKSKVQASGTIAGYFSSEFNDFAGASLGVNVVQQYSGSNEISTNFPITPVGFCSITPGARGRLGDVFDLWFGSPSVATGDTYGGSNLFAQFGNIVLPWPGVAPLVS